MSTHTTPSNPYLDVRPSPGSRHGIAPTRRSGKSLLHHLPVLPRGWAPLTTEQQRAVLEACDTSPEGMVFSIASVTDPEAEYRVYRLENESWAGLWLASACWADGEGPVGNRVLLGLGSDASVVVGIALEVVNHDLDARGESWRLGVERAPVLPAGSRRI